MNKILNFKGEYKGLDSKTAAENLLQYGSNSVYPDMGSDTSGGNKFYGVFKSLRLYLMLISVMLYFLAGVTAGGILLLFLTFGFCAFEILLKNYCVQKMRYIADSADVKIRVVRDGEIKIIKSADIVQDDIIVLQGGEHVPADAHILEAANVTVNESLFTDSADAIVKTPGADEKNELKRSCVYKGTRILSGMLIARVFDTGQDTRVSNEFLVRGSSYTRLGTFIKKRTIFLTYISAAILTIISIVSFITIGSDDLSVDTAASANPLLAHLNLILLPVISFALCTVPISLGLIVRVFHIDSAEKLSSKYGKVRCLRALEKLNSITAVCIDRDLIIDADQTPLVAESTKNSEMLARIAVLAGKKSPTDSYERAISVDAKFKRIDSGELLQNKLLRSYTPESDFDYNKIHGNLWEINGSRLLCIKGMPDVVLALCKVPPERHMSIKKKFSEYSKEGHCVMAVAYAQIQSDDGENQDKNSNTTVPGSLFEVEYAFVGLMAFSMGIKENIPVAVKNYYRAGVKVIMLTSDNKETAIAVAKKIGLQGVLNKSVITGGELSKLASIALGKSGIQSGSPVNIIAGVQREQKADVVSRLKMYGEKVAVFGGSDYTDIETLETADVGISLSSYTTNQKWDNGLDTLSQKTTGSVCETCDLTIEQSGLNGDGIVKAATVIRKVRLMYHNIRSCISVAISAYAALILFGIVNLSVSSGNVLDPVLISLLTVLVTPAVILCFFITNKVDSREQLQPSKLLGDRKLLTGALIQGFALFVAALIMFLVFGANEAYTAGMLRSIFLTVFTAGAVAMAWVKLSSGKPFYRCFGNDGLPAKREWNKNGSIVFTAGLLLFIPFAVYLPFVNTAFRLEAVSLPVFVLSLVVGGISQLWFDFVKKRFV